MILSQQTHKKTWLNAKKKKSCEEDIGIKRNNEALHFQPPDRVDNAPPLPLLPESA
jgi:hypothetical protein